MEMSNLHSRIKVLMATISWGRVMGIRGNGGRRVRKEAGAGERDIRKCSCGYAICMQHALRAE